MMTSDQRLNSDGSPPSPAAQGSAAVQSVVGMRSFGEVMEFAAENGWTEQMFVDVCKQKFGRVRHGVGVLRVQYRDCVKRLSESNTDKHLHQSNL